MINSLFDLLAITFLAVITVGSFAFLAIVILLIIKWLK